MKHVVVALTVVLLSWVSPTLNAMDVSEILAGKHRSEENKSRDAHRNPQQTIDFFGIQPHHSVVEMLPGDGWYSEILAPYVKEQGKFTAVTFATDNLNSDDKKKAFWAKHALKYREKMSNQDLYGDVAFAEFEPPRVTDCASAESADFALVVRVLHVWDETGHMKDGFDALYKALKPGGTLGVIQHRANMVSDYASTAVDGYLDQRYVVEVAEMAGFKLVSSSEINANGKDTKDYPKGVYALPPTLAMGQLDRDKYLDIGESDRMTLKFVKPSIK